MATMNAGHSTTSQAYFPQQPKEITYYESIRRDRDKLLGMAEQKKTLQEPPSS